MRLLYILFFFSFYISFSQSPLISMDESSQKKWVDSVYQPFSRRKNRTTIYCWVAQNMEKKNRSYFKSYQKIQIGRIIFL